MTINFKNAIIVNFRSKFSKKMLNDENREKVCEIVKDFCRLSPVVARPHLWKMSYDANTIVEEKFKESGLDLTSPENIALFRNELRFQYEKLYPEFVCPDLPENFQEAYSDLKDKMVDSVGPYMVWQRIQSLLEKVDNDSIERTLFLLNSDKEANYFGGLRSLRFGLKESDYLKPYHLQIHGLLKVMFDYKNHSNEVSDESQPLDTSVESQPEVQNTSSPDTVVVTPEEETLVDNTTTEENTSNFKALTALAVLENKDIFEEVVLKNNLNKLIALGSLGFDLNKVMARGEDIRLLLQVAKQLEAEPVMLKSPFEG